MSRSKLFLMVQEKNSEEKEIFRRLDTDEIIPKERMHPVKRPPIIMHLDSPFDLPIYIEKIRGFREKANALLAGDIMGNEEEAYCSLAYYFVSKV